MNLTTQQATQVYSVFICAPPDVVWEATTKPTTARGRRRGSRSGHRLITHTRGVLHL